MGLGKVFKGIGRGVRAVVTAPAAAVETGKRIVMVKVIMGVVRHLLTAAGGAAVANGYLTGGEVEQVVGGLAVVIGVVLSAVAKRKGIDIE